MQILALKSTAMLFISIAPFSGDSNKILCILVAEWVAKLQEVKVGGRKKNLR